MKKIISTILIIIFITTFNSAFAAITISPNMSCNIVDSASLGEIEFAESTIEYFLGMDYQIVDAYQLTIPYTYGIVTFKLDYALYDGDILIIIFNQNQHYYLTPIIINNYILCDFTNISPDTYYFYIITNFI